MLLFFCQGEVRCEAPNNRLDRFTGTLTFAGQKYALDNEKILLRGCTLRNTGWCFGLVLFAGRGNASASKSSPQKLLPSSLFIVLCFFEGQETKLMQNCGKSTFKRTSVDRLMNVLVLCVSAYFISLSLYNNLDECSFQSITLTLICKIFCFGVSL